LHLVIVLQCRCLGARQCGTVTAPRMYPIHGIGLTPLECYGEVCQPRFDS
jgi:hypothetical protein